MNEKTINFLKSKFFIAISISFFTITSCSPDKGETNPTSDRENFVGTWKCQENSSRYGTSTFDIQIGTDSSNSSNILIENIYNLGFKYKTSAIVNGNSFRIPSQSISGNIIEGSGISQTTNIINMKYLVNDGGGIIDSVSSILNRR